MKEEILIEVIKSTINGEEHLGVNLKEQCIKYIENLQSQLKVKGELIKEVSEYIEEHELDYIYLDCKLIETKVYYDLLRILSKGENK